MNINYDPWGVANLEPRGLIGRIYIGDQYTEKKIF